MEFENLATERIKSIRFDEKEPIKIALIDGEEVKYFACSSRRNDYKKQEKNGRGHYLDNQRRTTIGKPQTTFLEK